MWAERISSYCGEASMTPGAMGFTDGMGGAPVLRWLIMSGRGTVCSEPMKTLSAVPNRSQISWKREKTNMSYFST